ncbi:MAG: hypothetical protein JHD16_12820 [Solirubrobacteraceae bacterium]|nr:hypothetical protein [Solirubrobacteraceae bacterium]
MSTPSSPIRVSCVSLPVHGHMTPLLPVLAELVQRGVVVDALVSDEFAAPATATGAAITPYPEWLEQHVERPSDNVFAVAALLATLTADQLLDLTTAYLQRTKPDVVLTDSMAPWGRLAGERLGVPVVTSTSSFVFTARSGASPRATLDLLRRAGQGAGALATIARTSRAMRRRYGVDTGGPLRLLSNRGDATLVYTSAELQPAARHLGPSAHFVGPTAAERPAQPLAGDDPLAPVLQAAAGGAPLAYVSLGTIYNEQPAFLRAAAQALSSLGMTVVVAVGERVPLASLGPLPEGVVAVRSAPQLLILDHAKVFVTHGGMNSVHESLWRGVPMVVFPQAADQPIVGDRLKQLGAGVVLRGREPSVEEIRRAASAMLTAPASERAQALGRGLRAGGGASAAADVILELV